MVLLRSLVDNAFRTYDATRQPPFHCSFLFHCGQKRAPSNVAVAYLREFLTLWGPKRGPNLILSAAAVVSSLLPRLRLYQFQKMSSSFSSFCPPLNFEHFEHFALASPVFSSARNETIRCFCASQGRTATVVYLPRNFGFIKTWRVSGFKMVCVTEITFYLLTMMGDGAN